MSPPSRKLIALAVAAAAIVALPACGDDESQDTGLTGIEIQVPTATTPTTTAPAEEGQTSGGGQGTGDDEQAGDQPGKGKRGKGTGNAPEVGGLPKPSRRERALIAECIERANGDPKKIAACNEILEE